MATQQRVHQIPAKAEELRKLFGEDIVFMNGEPRLAGDLLFIARGRWQLAKIAIGHAAKLVIIVEDNAPMAGDAKVLWKKVAGKDVRRGKVLDRLTIINHRSPSSELVRFGKIKIQGAHPPLNIKVLKSDIIILDTDGVRRSPPQLFE